MGVRITVVTIFASLAFSALIFKLYNIQIEKVEYYRAQAASIYNSGRYLLAPRGDIYFSDREGSSVPAALSREYPTIFAVPSSITDLEGAVKFLSSLTGRDRSQLEKMLSDSEDPYEPVLRKASERQVSLFKENKIPGVDVEYEPARFYPLGTTASHVLGYVSSGEKDSGGRYGIEAYYDERLSGVRGKIDGDKLRLPKNGEDIRLTIVRDIQVEAERILKKLVEEHRGAGGTVMVAEPKTGKILAMANLPNFDPNDYGKFDIKNFLNPAVQAVYEPGSIFKIITMASGIDAGKITPETTFYDTGSLVLNGRKIANWDLKAHGQVTMTNVIEQSINTGAAFAERALGNDLFYDYLVKFGFKKKTGIDLPGEVAGSLAPLEKNSREINFATASFGQGVSVTPIGLVTAIGAIANHGVMMKPYLNADESPNELGRVVSNDAARKVTDMMISAVNKAGIAAIKGYGVAGKTGTAQVPDFKRGGYTEDVIDTYVGFAPAYDPKFIVLVKLDKPAGGPHAALTVVPAFREMAQFILNYYKIPPDNLEATNK